MAALEAAKELKANLVIFPELTLTPQLRECVQTWLYDNQDHGFAMLIPGSFHEMVEPSQDPINRAVLLSGLGETLLQHNKIIPFSTAGMHENITSGDTLTLLDSPIGLIALAICRDFLESDDNTKLPWQSVAPHWALIPSMSEIQGVRAHLRQAKILAMACGTRALVPNQSLDGNFPAGQPIYSETSPSKHGFAVWPEVNGTPVVTHVTPWERLFLIPL
ncbi:nitrilase-related carbon-nitrogen hydrolase [Magnetococcus marinus]|uniref:nitrilase-related carbon-nitrogen hydrolase n=1 Tax=Magnetococcus marinus TaxID=1124597 RepID=UPI00003C5908|nr:nitrilase-related carbon-nitrogen hydrolase [Magnetococcus marinus]